jgi:hypothetical protein
MSDKKEDQSTADTATPVPAKRRGRPKLFDVPLTGAERAKRYRRARKSAPEEVSECRDSVLMERLRFALKWKTEGGDSDAIEALDIYLEELIRRHHSRGVKALK